MKRNTQIDLSKVSKTQINFKDFKQARITKRRRINKVEFLASIPKGKYIACLSGAEHCLPKYKNRGKIFPYIFNFKANRQLKTRISRNDLYPCLDICSGKKKMTFLVHDLFAILFVKNKKPNERVLVDHIDDDKLNYKINNLQWVSQSENQKKDFKKKKKEYEAIKRKRKAKKQKHK